MCGIAGYITKSKVKAEDLELMLMMLTHRGPDEFGTYVAEHAALGSARLAIIDVKGGQQPIQDEERQVTIVFNGEIYNYIELREQLKKDGVRFAGNSDTEVILKSYLRHGEDFCREFNGEFAIAIWDEREKKLILARDRIGIRPLYYFEDNERLIFASEMKSILIHRDVPRKLNAKALDQIFTFWTPIGEHTCLQDIKMLSAGYLLIAQNGQVKSRAFWQWPFPSLCAKSSLSFKDEKQEFLARLEKAVRYRMRADVEVGSYLSGGIDSSAIVALCAPQSGATLRTFSVAFKEKSYDERIFQDRVAKLFKTKHEMVECDYGDIGKVFKDVVWHAETPVFRTAPAPLFLLSQLVRKHKIKVVLTGEGSDEILLGYDLYRQVKIRKFWRRQPHSKFRWQLFRKLYGYLPQFSDQRYAQVAIQSFKTDLLSDSPFYSHLVPWYNNAANKAYFSAQILKNIKGYDCYEELRKSVPAAYFKASPIDQAQYLDLITLLRGYLLSSQGDRMSMAHSVEGRYPFLDHEFVEYVSTLPEKYKLMGLNDKRILREAFADILPEEICRRPKVAYQAPEIRPFISPEGKVSALAAHYLDEKRIKDFDVFDWDVVQSLLNKIKGSDQTRLGMRDNMAFVQIFSTQIFIDQFLKQDIRTIAQEKKRNNKVKFTKILKQSPMLSSKFNF